MADFLFHKATGSSSQLVCPAGCCSPALSRSACVTSCADLLQMRTFQIIHIKLSQKQKEKEKEKKKTLGYRIAYIIFCS